LGLKARFEFSRREERSRGVGAAGRDRGASLAERADPSSRGPWRAAARQRYPAVVLATASCECPCGECPIAAMYIINIAGFRAHCFRAIWRTRGPRAPLVIHCTAGRTAPFFFLLRADPASLQRGRRRHRPRRLPADQPLLPPRPPPASSDSSPEEGQAGAGVGFAAIVFLAAAFGPIGADSWRSRKTIVQGRIGSRQPTNRPKLQARLSAIRGAPARSRQGIAKAPLRRGSTIFFFGNSGRSSSTMHSCQRIFPFEDAGAY